MADKISTAQFFGGDPEKAGFRRVGILRETVLMDGKFCDEYIYEMLIGK